MNTFLAEKRKKLKENAEDHFKSYLFTYIEYVLVLVALKRHIRANISIYFKVKPKITTTIAGNRHSTPTRDKSKTKIIIKWQIKQKNKKIYEQRALTICA